MLSRPRRIALVVVPLAVAVAVGIVVAVIAHAYRDDAVRWTAIGAVLTGAALLVGLVGLPVAVFQLFAVQEDLARLALVPPGHFDQLKGLITSCFEAINRQEPMRFDQDDESQLFEDTFFAHFPDLHSVIGTWNLAVRDVIAGRRRFAAKLARLADEAHLSEIFDRATVLEVLQERMPPTLHLAIEDWPADVPVSTDQRGMVISSRFLAAARATDRFGAQIARDEDEIERAARSVIGLCERARTVPEVSQFAYAQDTLNGLLSPTREALILWNLTETFPVAALCPLCERNSGLARSGRPSRVRG